MELLKIIRTIPSSKAPGLSLLARPLDQTADLTEALFGFYNHRTCKLHLANEANIFDQQPGQDHNEATGRETCAPPREIVSQSQNAFIKGRCIHDNFLYVQRVIRKLHKIKRKALFIKLDISKAFDSINWPYLLEVLEVLGFGTRWRNWIAALLATSSSGVLLNGKPGKKIVHRRGLRQGDPLSPMLFILAIDPLQRIIERAVQSGVLSQILPRPVALNCSLYPGIFAKADASELGALCAILQTFSRRKFIRSIVNPMKLKLYRFGLLANSTPSLPDTLVCPPPPPDVRKLRRIDVQPLIDKVRAWLPGWKGKLLSKAGRITLVKTVLSAQPIYHLTVFPAQKWLIRQIDKIRRSFLWKREEPENTCGGHCLVNWPTVTRPLSLGGLGIADLECFVRALRLRWLWFQWKNRERAWVGLDVPCDKEDRDLFHASKMVTVGDGVKASFWCSHWINGMAARLISPSLYAKTSRKNISVRNALKNNNWISHIFPVSSVSEVKEFVDLWEALRERDAAQEDKIVWRWTTNGVYSAKSAYLIQFLRSHAKLKLLPIWKARVEPKCRFFAWTLLHKKILTADNLQKRGWNNDPVCKLCKQEPETITHLVKDCIFTKSVWSQISLWLNLSSLPRLDQFSSVYSWWKKCRCKVEKGAREDFDGLICLFWWELWKERNRRIFQGLEKEERVVAGAAFNFAEPIWENRWIQPKAG
ncbi:LOW QUALITY PROTEIN: hypothetical protein U9M48_017814 [Paspalum notatum var. saurae]|uniref:Reverse transcriptase domain-containing protein n=1 Tax=Paspalum notatum var. saurae TaxID=547442 RepID=A0AAQ3T8R7_PASNO